MADEKNKKLEEISQELGNTLQQMNQTNNQQMQFNPQPSPQDKFQQLVGDLYNTARQQQIQTEQTTQETLSQASTSLVGAQKIDEIHHLTQQLQQGVTQQGIQNNPQYYFQMIEKIEDLIHDQLHQADQQIAQSLQQSISAMAQGQASMFDSNCYSQLRSTLKELKYTLRNW